MTSPYHISQIDLDKELARFSTIEELKKNLKDLFELDKSLLTPEEIQKLVFEKAIVLPNFFAPIPKETINLLKLFRVRAEKTMDMKNEDLSLIRTFSYPSPCFCSRNGRANLKNKSVFYCADIKETALAESNLEKNDVAYLSIWKIACDREANYTAYLPTNIPDKNVWYSKALQLYTQSISHTEKYGKEKAKHLEVLYSFFSAIFVKESKPYSLTSWIANNMLYDYDVVDFIIYPSFATSQYSCNMAFHPNFVDNHLKLDRVFKLLITNVEQDTIRFLVTQTGKVRQTSIIWNDTTEEDINEHFFGAIKVEVPNNGG